MRQTTHAGGRTAPRTVVIPRHALLRVFLASFFFCLLVVALAFILGGCFGQENPNDQHPHPCPQALNPSPSGCRQAPLPPVHHP